MSAMEVPGDALVKQLSEELKKLDELKPPEWSHYVKTGVHRERPPEQPDWWYARAASVLRRIYLDGPIGLSRLRTFYGGRQKRGSSPEHFRKGGGKILRTILQQLEHGGLVAKTERGGRKMTPKGASMLDSISAPTESGEKEKPKE
jgi:small subunit ribosomal protein S19e